MYRDERLPWLADPRPLLRLLSPPSSTMFEIFKLKFEIHLPLGFARRQPPLERLARCPMSPYYIVFYDFDFCMFFVNFVARTKQKYASIVVWRSTTTDKNGAGSEASSAMPHVAVV